MSGAIATAPAAGAILDTQQPHKPFIPCNAAYERLSGFQEAEIVGQNLVMLHGALLDR